MQKERDIILIGFMGCGKTSVGKRISRMGGLTFVDTDDMIIAAEGGRSINDIFAKEGEPYFRDLETKMLERLLGTADSEERRVISVGGGLPVRPENRTLMRRIGTVIYLQADVQTLVERLRMDTTRPLLQTGEDPETRIRSLMQQREHLYLDAADISVSTGGRSQFEVAADILRMARGSRSHGE